MGTRSPTTSPTKGCGSCSAFDVAARMFARWRQENFFKYLREGYALDALVDYAVAPDDPTREVPNPRWSDF